MAKTILITGATDGIGRETARKLEEQGQRLLLHGRNSQRLHAVADELGGAPTYVADLSRLSEVRHLADEIIEQNKQIDVLINNAGVFKTQSTRTDDGLDVRFAVNTIAPYLLTSRLLHLMPSSGRVVNVSSASQSQVIVDALIGQRRVRSDMDAYAQSKAAITAWTLAMAAAIGDGGPTLIAVNPGSLLASKMVKEGFGIAGSDLAIGADILARAALSEEFAEANGKYYDNDAKRFAEPENFVREQADDIVRALEVISSLA